MSDAATGEKKKVLIVEDHPLFRGMLVQLINKEPTMTVCGEADNIKDAMSIIRKMHPDAAIVDITLKGSSGLELLKDIKNEGLSLPVLVISMHEEALYAERVLRAGARGYVSKNEQPATVLAAFKKVLSGSIYLGDSMATAILEKLGQVETLAAPTGMSSLSDRELEVFQLLGKGMNSREISQRITLGQSTVDSYRNRIKEKLGLKNAAAVYQYAARWLMERNV